MKAVKTKSMYRQLSLLGPGSISWASFSAIPLCSAVMCGWMLGIGRPWSALCPWGVSSPR